MKLSKNVNSKKCAPKLIFFNEKRIRKMLLQKLLPPFIVQAFKTKTASHISRSILFVNSRPSIDLRPHTAHFHLILFHISLQLSNTDLKTIMMRIWIKSTNRLSRKLDNKMKLRNLFEKWLTWISYKFHQCIGIGIEIH